jgi:two-component system sensor histidine kinase UhpB
MSERAKAAIQQVAQRSLVTRVFLANAAILLGAYLVLIFAPVTIDAPVTAGQLVGLTVGLVIVFVVDWIVVRRSLAPLQRLTAFCAEISTTRQGRRIASTPWHSREARELTQGFNTMLDRLEGERRDSGRLALAAQEGERARVASALHDELGQALTAMTLSAQRAATADPEQMRATLEELAESSQRSLEEVRRLARELRPEALDDLGLVNALIALVRRVDEQSGVRVRHRFEALPPLSDEIELAIYRVAQESLTNVIRHAGASRAEITVRPEGDLVVLSVADDGRGLAGTPGPDATGIAGMRERAVFVGGRLELGDRNGEGTEVRFEVPIEAGA